MNLQAVRIIRISLGVTAAVAASYAMAWPLYYIAPLFAYIFLGLPAWIGWKKAVALMIMLGVCLLAGLVISEFFLDFPSVCIPLYALLFFFIYYNDTPAAPPMAAMFMTLGITIVPIMKFSGAGIPHVVAGGLIFDMAFGLFCAWCFHLLVPERLEAQEAADEAAGGKPDSPPVPPREERVRLALVSTIVALSAICLFFFFNLSQYSLAMIYICFMAGNPSSNASIRVMKANALATCIGGAAIIVAFNLLVAVPNYLFLLTLVFSFALFFSSRAAAGGTMAPAFSSGFITFLVLLGSSTGVDKTAAANFYMRIAQVLFAGLFTVVAIIVVERLLRRGRRAGPVRCEG